jgi:LmbE family N-acetylglucosaminyl deacetylase
MAAAADNGTAVTCVTATLGEHGTPDPATWPPDRLGRVRSWEAAAAMAVLGIEDHRCLGLPDGGLDGLDAIGIARVGALLDELDPRTILTFAPDGATFHPDHIAVHRWVMAAWERSGRRARVLCAAISEDHHREFAGLYEEWGVYMTDERPVPPDDDRLALRVVARGPALDRKLVALAAMASQTRPAADLLGDRYAAMAAEECFVDAAEVVDLVRPLLSA